MLGVALAEWLRRSHERTTLRTSTMALATKVPLVIAGMTETGPPTDTAINSQWWQDRQSVMEMLILISNKSMRFRRNGKAIKTQARDLSARITAAELEYFSQGRLLTRDEAANITHSGLFTAVFGDSGTMDSDIQSYMHSAPERSVSSVPTPSLRKRILTKGRKYFHI